MHCTGIMAPRQLYSTLALALSCLSAPAIADSTSYDQNAGALANALATLYNQGQGVWYDGNSLLWWQSANALTATIDLMSVDSTQKSQHMSLITSTFQNAPNSNPHSTRKRSANGIYTEVRQPYSRIERTLYSLRKRQSQGFLNGYYDDEGWWALAWLDAWDLTKTIDYLNTAVGIWQDMSQSTASPCGGAGGIYWDKKHSYIATISNQLYFAVSASLSNRVGSNTKQTYVNAAKKSWSWLKNSGLQQSNGLFNDGFDLKCNQQTPTWSYNQGVVIGGLVDMYKATGSTTWLDQAATIANAVIANGGPFVQNGIMHEINNCDKTNGCGADGNIFRGVFVRNLRKLQQARPTASYKSFLQTNAQSIWQNDLTITNGNIFAGVNWAGPSAGTPEVGSQVAALDCVNGALMA